MTDPNRNGVASEVIAEPPFALATGALLGGLTFLLCALLLGARAAICVAALFLVGALLRRSLVASLLFAICGALAAAALAGSTTLLILSSTAFGIALAPLARTNANALLAIRAHGDVKS